MEAEKTAPTVGFVSDGCNRRQKSGDLRSTWYLAPANPWIAYSHKTMGPVWSASLQPGDGRLNGGVRCPPLPASQPNRLMDSMTNLSLLLGGKK